MSHASEQQDSTLQEKGPGYIARRVTDTTEAGLETLIVNGLIRNGWQTGDSQNYDRGYCVDLGHLSKFLKATQPKVAEELQLDTENPVRRAVANRIPSPGSPIN